MLILHNFASLVSILKRRAVKKTLDELESQQGTVSL